MFDKALPVADEMAIRNLIARYAHFADAGDLDAYAGLFTEDGSWTRENSPPPHLGGSGLPAETVTGAAALKGMIEASIIRRFNGKYRHQMTDILVGPGDGPDDAAVLFRALITNWRDGPGQLAMCGTYTCRCVRTDDGWRFKSVGIYVLPD